MSHGVVFDMGGVVIDSHHAHRAAWRNFLEAELVGANPIIDDFRPLSIAQVKACFV